MLERDGVTVIFDGYLLDDYTLSAQEQVIQLHHEFLSKGIDFIKHRNFFGNILFDTKDCVYVVSSQHALFHLFYTVNDDSSFIVAPSIKFILPYLKALSLDKQGYFELLNKEYCLNNKTMFSDLKKIGSNQILMYKKYQKILSVESYTKEYWRNTPQINLTNNAQKDARAINELFRTATKKSTDIFKGHPLAL